MLAGAERRDRRPDVPVGSLDDRVAASEHCERRQGGETPLRGHGALPPERHGTSDGAVKCATCLIDSLPSHREPHRRRPAIEHASRCLEAATTLLDAVPNPSDAQIREWMVGNLCRCTGYYKIVESVRAAAERSRA